MERAIAEVLLSEEQIKTRIQEMAEVLNKEYADKNLSPALEEIMEGRSVYVWRAGDERKQVIAADSSHYISCAMPIVSEGDVVGCVVSLADSNGERGRDAVSSDVETKLIMTAAGFLGKQMES